MGRRTRNNPLDLGCWQTPTPRRLVRPALNESMSSSRCRLSEREPRRSIIASPSSRLTARTSPIIPFHHQPADLLVQLCERTLTDSVGPLPRPREDLGRHVHERLLPGVDLVRMNCAMGRQFWHRRISAQRRKCNFGLESHIRARRLADPPYSTGVLGGRDLI